MVPSIGIIVNPRSGGDIRRAVAAAGRSTVEDKVSIVRRIVLGAAAGGVDTIVVNHDPHQIVRRATETLRDVRLVTVVRDLGFTEEDSTRAAVAMREEGCAAVAVLGGDGTNRAVAKGWQDIVVLPVSTGTNNAFPIFVEPTVAGTSLAMVARGIVDVDAVTSRAKLVHLDLAGGVAGADGEAGNGTSEVALDGQPSADIALIDAVAVADPYVGSLELFDPDTMRLAVLTRADPGAIGFAAVGGLLDPLTAADDAALLVRFAPVADDPPIVVTAPTAPGHHTPIGVQEVRRLELGEAVETTGPVLLAFDGERKRRVHDQVVASLVVRRDGPRVVDPHATMAAARDAFVHRR